ncbi:hypothetical protein IHE45_10G001200 [Dioscorea alata]|uniref:Uncharacterized protein n=1 Tax=Dioscorea alata TaxID=55571 RepID=A0ACB7V956_DIOAL|nr:hypothetical protein IHE45_10G001200 [Dioscorea alata]
MEKIVATKEISFGTLFAGFSPWVRCLGRRPPFSCQASSCLQFKYMKLCLMA